MEWGLGNDSNWVRYSEGGESKGLGLKKKINSQERGLGGHLWLYELVRTQTSKLCCCLVKNDKSISNNFFGYYGSSRVVFSLLSPRSALMIVYVRTEYNPYRLHLKWYHRRNILQDIEVRINWRVFNFKKNA
mgnify:CR=1 FL=1